MFDLVIEIRGGVLVGIYTKGNDVRVGFIDWDNEQYGSPASIEQPIEMAEIPIETRRALAALNSNIADHSIKK